MTHQMKTAIYLTILYLLLFGVIAAAADGQNDRKRFRFELEGGPVYKQAKPGSCEENELIIIDFKQLL